MSELREISYRAINEVLRRPEVEEPLGLTGCLLPMGEDFHYLRCGSGLVLYFVKDGVAHMHGLLLRGDAPKAPQAFREHCDYLRALGVRRVTTRHRASHRRASYMCRVLGFERVVCDEGFKRYEKVISHG